VEGLGVSSECETVIRQLVVAETTDRAVRGGVRIFV
jgi:hypothetical protein